MRQSTASRRLRGLIALTVLALLLVAGAGTASAYPTMPTGSVADLANVLTPSERAQLADMVKTLESKTTCEVAIVTVGSTGDQTPLEYRVGLFNEWGLGKKGKDNGLLILVVTGVRRLEVEVGYGLEPIITDALVGSYLDDYAVPSLKGNKYGEGLLKLTQAFSDLLVAKYDPANPPTSTGSGSTQTTGTNSADEVDGWIWHEFRWLKVLLWFGIPFSVALAFSLWRKPHCPQCRGTLRVDEVVVRPPTPDTPGSGHRTLTCDRCGYSHEEEYEIPFIGLTGEGVPNDVTGTRFGRFGRWLNGFGGGGFGGGGFGGGGSGGGGGGASGGGGGGRGF